ncbi:unnamed protein product [Adineta ricciae]|uniref:TIL domain-containing protein n=1 Tax=Adineta ricciae TaxID=249248 RepID=A0A813NMV1_ADIRI|nr:unnamed protein product [Adineta ricciae]CAF1019772.1 unnamed protein product [Adineta ricciae]
MVSFKLVACILAFLLVGSIVAEARRSRCDKHEHFDRCGKPLSCQSSCEQIRGRMCHAACVPTCMCNGDRVRDRFNKCVRPHECRRVPHLF